MKLPEVARRLNLRNVNGLHLPPLILMTDAVRLPDPVAAARRLPPGSAVILRHYEARDRAELAFALAQTAREIGLKLLIGADAKLAQDVGAQGVHLPEALAREARHARRRRDWLVTAAAHSWPALLAAAQGGADAALLSPVFTTRSHPGTPALGPWGFATLTRMSPLPIYALGGINDANAGHLLHSGAVGIAGIGGLAPEA